MALRHGRNAQIYVNGVDISGDLNTVNPTSEQELADVSVFGNVGHTLYPGLSKDTATIEAIYNNTEKGVFEGMIQATPASTAYGMMIAFGGAVGDPAYATEQVVLKSNSIKAVVTDVNRASINVEASGLPFEAGKLLTAGIVAGGSTGTLGTILDDGGASGTTGGVFYIQAFTVGSSAAIFTRLVTSSTGAFAGEEASTSGLTFATTGTYRLPISTQIFQYVRYRFGWIINGSNTASTSTFALSLVRY